MTATIKTPHRQPTRRRVRFSSLETLGFSSVASVWSDTPTIESEPQRGRHVASAPEPTEVADWQPQEFGSRLIGSNVRWGTIVAIAVAVTSLATFGYWVYQQADSREATAQVELASQARALETALPALTEFNQRLLTTDSGIGSGNLSGVESAARDLFDTSGSLSSNGQRSVASQAAGSTLDGVRLAREAHAYRSALAPVLEVPQLETHPDLIALDEAARLFGSWQLSFDEVRRALPEGIFTDVKEQVDVLSGDLTSFLQQYVTALRKDDQRAAESALASLRSRLQHIEEGLIGSIEDIQARVDARVDESLAALQRLVR